MKRVNAVVCLTVLVATHSCTWAKVLQVGPARTYTSISAAAGVAVDGDVIEIDSGTYVGKDCYAVFNQSNLTIRGVGPSRPVLDADFTLPGTGQDNNKGLFVINGNNTTVENLELKNAQKYSVSSSAGIRYQGGSLTLCSCYIHDCDNGVLGTPDVGAYPDILFEYCEFNHNGYGDGQSHNFYIGNTPGATHCFTMRYCYSHNCRRGHEVKTRAEINYILYNRIGNEAANPYDKPNASFEVSAPNGGTTYLIGNLIEQNASSDNSLIIDYDSEGHDNGAAPYYPYNHPDYTPQYENPDLHLYIVNNTVVNDMNDGNFVRNYSSVPTLLWNNVFQGSSVTKTLVGEANGSQGAYVGSPQPLSTWSWITTNAFLADSAHYDYHLTSASSGAIDTGTVPSPSTGVDGFSLIPVHEYVHPCSYRSRPVDSYIDRGAYEYVTVPKVQFNTPSGAGSESVSAVSIPVSLSAASASTVTVQYAATGGTATAGSDYTVSAGTLTFSPGQTTQNIPVTIINDALWEPDETIVIALSDPTNAILGDRQSYTYTIQNDDGPTVQFASSIGSGSESTASVSIPVTLSAAGSSAIIVPYTVDGTGTAGVDYTLSNGKLTFNPGVTTQYIPLTIINDTIFEPNETVVVKLVNAPYMPYGARLGANTTYTYTILDNDAPAVQFQVASGTGSEGASPVDVTVTLSRASTQTVTVPYSVGGTAALGTDYTLPAAISGGTVALKRNPGMSLPVGLDTRFQTAQLYASPGIAADADMYIWPAYDQNLGLSPVYKNFGGTPAAQACSPIFTKFDLSVLPGLTGSTINKAQLRFYYSAGDTGLGRTALVTSRDWVEGVGNGAYPGATGGISYAHPMGYNTSQNQDAGGGTTGPLRSWANNEFFDVSKDVSASYVGCTKVAYAGGGDPAGGFAVMDITSLVQGWASGVPNYGLCTYDLDDRGNYVNNYTVQYSETAKPTDYQPVLCVDYSLPAATRFVTFAPGETSKTIPISVLSDNTLEGSETIQLILGPAANATLGSNTTYTYTITGQSVLGDVNGDGHVNVGDLQALVAAWGALSTPPSSNWNPAADFNSDGFINVADLQILVAHWGA